jgi:saccharopine dehydrogenase-like NADP-dependent oxidoreductase
MNRVLVLGAGLVSRPGVQYLLKNGLTVTVASRTVSKAEKLVQGFENGTAKALLVENTDELEKLVQENDIIVSLLPWVHHVEVAKMCIKNSRRMATTSYVSEDMQKLDADVKSKGLLFLNEIGVDPGIDHMSAMKIIDEVHENGGKVLHFYSYCGGLPAPEDNDNPFGYKFSWSPKGVVLASRNSAKFLENGEIVNIEGKDLFLNKRPETVEGLGDFEVYPNRDSMPYQKIYGLEEAQTVMRGTYRNIGWCDTFKKIVDLGLVDETPVPGIEGVTFKKMMADMIGVSEDDDVKAKTAEKVGLPADDLVINNLEWLGLFSDERVAACDNRLDILSEQLLEKLKYADGERDMIILRHKFTVENEDNSKDLITSTLIDFGIPNGDSSMARTVSLPLGIGVKLMSENKIDLTGVQIPILKEVYNPVLKELETQGIKMEEKKTPVS